MHTQFFSDLLIDQHLHQSLCINISKQDLSWCQQTFKRLKQSLLLCSMIFSASPHRRANHSQEYKLQNNKCSWLRWPSACGSQGRRSGSD